MCSASLIGVNCVPITVNTKRTGTVPPPSGGAQCCQNVQNSSNVSSDVLGIITGLLGLNLSGLNIPIGTGCAPLSILGGVSCNTNTVQCGQVDQCESLPQFTAAQTLTVPYSLAHRHQLRPDHDQPLSGALTKCAGVSYGRQSGKNGAPHRHLHRPCFLFLKLSQNVKPIYDLALDHSGVHT
jgi:hypothetical protein